MEILLALLMTAVSAEVRSDASVTAPPPAAIIVVAWISPELPCLVAQDDEKKGGDGKDQDKEKKGKKKKKGDKKDKDDDEKDEKKGKDKGKDKDDDGEKEDGPKKK